MDKVISESQLEEARKEIIEGLTCINDEIGLINGYIEKLPEELVELENSLQTEGGKSIANNIAGSIEEIQNQFNMLQNIIVNSNDIVINWTQIPQKEFKQEIRIKGGE